MIALFSVVTSMNSIVFERLAKLTKCKVCNINPMHQHGCTNRNA